MGEIVEVTESSTNIAYKIDDRTGPLIEVRRWISDVIFSLSYVVLYVLCIFIIILNLILFLF